MLKNLKAWLLTRKLTSVREHRKLLEDNAINIEASIVATHEMERQYTDRLAMIGMSDSERITRLAAKAIDLYVGDHYWDSEKRGMYSKQARLLSIDQFAPLVDPADAYRLESRLQMNVEYVLLVAGEQIIFVGLPTGETSAVTVKESESPLSCRMELVVRVAAIHALRSE